MCCSVGMLGARRTVAKAMVSISVRLVHWRLDSTCGRRIKCVTRHDCVVWEVDGEEECVAAVVGMQVNASSETCNGKRERMY
jgi:hypothetical protein